MSQIAAEKCRWYYSLTDNIGGVNMEQLKASLKGRHGLAVAVYSTPAAEAVLTRHGLSVVDFLRPLSLVNKLNGAVQ